VEPALLDPLWPGLCLRQVRQLADWMAEQPSPCIVMGDSNAGWRRGDALSWLLRATRPAQLATTAQLAADIS